MVARPAAAIVLVDRREAGFSLVELLVAATISLGVLAATMALAIQVQREFNIKLDAAAVRSEGEYAVKWIGEALREAGGNPYNLTTSTCPVAGTTFRAIRMDPDGDGLPDDIRIQSDTNPPNRLLGGAGAGFCTEANEDVTISYVPALNAITRRDNNVDAAAVTMTDGVITSLVFTYLDTNRVATAVEAAIAFVNVGVTTQTRERDPRTGQPRTVAITEEIRVRVR